MTATAKSTAALVGSSVSDGIAVASGIDVSTKINLSSPVATSTAQARTVVPSFYPSVSQATAITSVAAPVSQVKYIAPQVLMIADVGTIVAEDDKVAFEASASVSIQPLSPSLLLDIPVVTTLTTATDLAPLLIISAKTSASVSTELVHGDIEITPSEISISTIIKPVSTFTFGHSLRSR